ncbi:MAG: argininosuccinate synthase [Dehalococcoidia bacterium]
MMATKRAVLAFSGGLDTSAILAWMIHHLGWEVVTFTANLGQRETDSLQVAEEKSRMIGAVAHETVDIRSELVEEFFLPALQLRARLEGRYLLGTSLARYPTARVAMSVAKKYDASVLSHGATGKATIRCVSRPRGWCSTPTRPTTSPTWRSTPAGRRTTSSPVSATAAGG